MPPSDPPPPSTAGRAVDLVDVADARRPLAEGGPDAAHRRAAFGRRPDDVPVLPGRRRVWPWVLGVLLLLALLAFLPPLLRSLRAGRPDARAPGARTTPGAGTGAGTTVGAGGGR